MKVMDCEKSVWPSCELRAGGVNDSFIVCGQDGLASAGEINERGLD